MGTFPSFKKLSDAQLAEELARLARKERGGTAHLIVCLEEFDRRRLHLAAGFSSLYSYCGRELHLSEDAAYKRIEIARASRQCPRLLDMLVDGRLSLSTACLVAKQRSCGSFEVLLERAAFKTRREVEALIAALHPQPPVPSVLRKLPEPKAAPVRALVAEHTDEPPLSVADLVAAPPAIASRRPIVAPLSETHYKLQVTISSASRQRLTQIQGLMRHRIPNGDPAAIVEHALEVLHADLLKKKAAEVARPRGARGSGEVKGRYIPASIKRAVFRRDRGACAFVSVDGMRCGSTSALEFHHVRPYATGGAATVGNIELRCRAHNGFEWTRHLDEESAALAAR